MALYSVREKISNSFSNVKNNKNNTRNTLNQISLQLTVSKIKSEAQKARRERGGKRKKKMIEYK
jgi:hypothetical protein